MSKISIESLKASLATVQHNIKIVETFNIIAEMFENREKYTFQTYNGTCGLWNDFHTSLWSCGEIQFSQVKHYREMYKIMNDKPLKDNDLERFTKAENFIKRCLLENREETMNLLYKLEL